MSVHRTFSDERSPGAFHSLGALPKRKSDIFNRKSPVFHIAHDDDDDDDDNSSPIDEHPAPFTIPFPRSTSPPSPSSPPSSPPLSRGASAPILLVNGKPLKPSLKSLKSFSSPAMLIPPQSQHMHLRAHSAPSTPSSPKTVHFPEKDYGLATVRVFNRTARPAALSCPANGNGDETETEGEDTPSNGFPFPIIPPVFNYEIDPTKSTFVACKPSPHTNILLESLSLSSSSLPSSGPAQKPLLTGSVLVRNLAFEKHVAIRFTLDDWQTVSEVSAHYVDSLSTLPSPISPTPSLSATSLSDSSSHGKGWDRFAFTIRLEDYALSLTTRTMWLASRYRINSAYLESGSTEYGPGEWWDNNGGCNYRVGFRPASATPPRIKPRRETVSAPMILRPPPVRKEHMLGHMVPSTPNNKEIQPVNGTDKRSVPLRVGKLNLCNYVPPTARATSSVSFPSAGSSPSQLKGRELPPLATSQPSSDDDSTSPASSTLSTPAVSPTITPRIIMDGQPATQCERAGGGDEAMKASKPGRIANWEWSAPGQLRADLVPGSLLPPEKVLADHSLYDAFVTQWCFAQGPSLNHCDYSDGGIMA